MKLEANASDYRNKPHDFMAQFEEVDDLFINEDEDAERLAGHDVTGDQEKNTGSSSSRDMNDRGRGRTVETQGSGVAVLRAMLEFSKLAERCSLPVNGNHAFPSHLETCKGSKS